MGSTGKAPVGICEAEAQEVEAFLTDTLNFKANCKEIKKIRYKQFAVYNSVGYG